MSKIGFELNGKIYSLQKGHEWDDVEYALNREYGCGEIVRNILEDIFYTEADFIRANHDAEMGNEEKQMLLQDIDDELRFIRKGIPSMKKDEISKRLLEIIERISLYM